MSNSHDGIVSVGRQLSELLCRDDTHVSGTKDIGSSMLLGRRIADLPVPGYVGRIAKSNGPAGSPLRDVEDDEFAFEAVAASSLSGGEDHSVEFLADVKPGLGF